MNEPTEAQINRQQKLYFWKTVGFKYTGDDYHEEWVFNGKSFDNLPLIDLNNLFKHAVPKLIEKLGTYRANGVMSVWINIVVIDGVDPAYSLFWSIKDEIQI